MKMRARMMMRMARMKIRLSTHDQIEHASALPFLRRRVRVARQKRRKRKTRRISRTMRQQLVRMMMLKRKRSEEEDGMTRRGGCRSRDPHERSGG